MKLKNLLLAFFLVGLFGINAKAQKLYTVSSGEMIFSQSQATYTQKFMNQYKGASLAANNVRFTVFFHVGQYLHYDFSNSFGLFTGLAIRNIGMITDETLPQTVSLTGATVNYTNYKIIRRQYTLGLPLAFKVGDFGKSFYFYAGGEYEMAFHFKEKYWTGSFDRNDSKTKKTEWFSNQTPTFIPSVFAGFQLPGGFNVKFKYYLNNFLNNDYQASGNNVENTAYTVSDQTRYEDSNMFSLSLCWQFNTADMWK